MHENLSIQENDTHPGNCELWEVNEEMSTK